MKSPDMGEMGNMGEMEKAKEEPLDETESGLAGGLVWEVGEMSVGVLRVFGA